MMPDKRDSVPIRNSEGVKEHVQKRLLLANLKELYEIFKKKFFDMKVGFFMFASLRLKHFVSVDTTGAHTTCVCILNQNLKLLIHGKINKYLIVKFLSLKVL